MFEEAMDENETNITMPVMEPKSDQDLEQKLERRKEEFFTLCPELQFEDVTFSPRKKSVDISYKDVSLNVSYSGGFPKAIRVIFGLDSPLSFPDKVGIGKKRRTFIRKFKERFFAEHPLYAPFKILFHFCYTNEFKDVCIQFENESEIISINEESTFSIAFKTVDQYWENAVTEEDAIESYIAQKCPAYADIDFSVRKKPLSIGIDGQWKSVRLDNIPSLKSIQREFTYQKKREDFKVYLQTHLPEPYANFKFRETSAQRVDITYSPKQSYPIHPFHTSIRLAPNQEVEQWRTSFLNEYRNFLGEDILNLRSKYMRSLILKTMGDYRATYEKAGYYDLKPGTRKIHPLYSLLEGKDFTYNLKLNKHNSPNAYQISYGPYCFLYDLKNNSMCCIKKETGVHQTVKTLKRLEQRRDIIVKQLQTLGITGYKAFITQKCYAPSGLSVSIKNLVFEWRKTFPVDVKVKDIRDACKILKQEWTVYQKEEQRKKDVEVAKLKSTSCYGNLLTAAILRTIQENEWPPSISWLLSSLKADSLGRNYTRAELETEIENLLKIHTLDTEVRSSSKCGSYYVYKLASELTEYYIAPVPTHYRKNKKYDEYTDIDWMAFLQDFDPEKEHSILIWKRQLPIWGHINVLFSCTKELSIYFGAAPEQVKAYVRVMYEVSEDRTYRKALKRYLS